MIFIPPILTFGKNGKCRIRETRGDTDSRVSTFATYSAVWAAQSVGASLSPSGRDGAYTGGGGSGGRWRGVLSSNDSLAGVSVTGQRSPEPW